MLLVHAVGAVTPVGLDAGQTCASLRAALSGVEARIAQAPPNEPLLAAEVPARAELKRHPDRWFVHLAVRALRECLADFDGDISRLAFVLSVPEIFRAHPAITDQTGQALASRIVGTVGLRFSPHSCVLTMGNAAAAVGLKRVDDLLTRGDIDGAIVGGVDSLLADADLDRLRDAGRLYLPGHPFGVIPGEGAAFLLIGGSSRPLNVRPLAVIRGIGLAEETDSASGTRYSVGIAMRNALDAALVSAGEREGAVGWRITDVNGERYRTWESSALLARYYRSWRDGLPCMHLPAATGDLGAATQVLQLVFGAIAMQRGYAPAALAVCEAGSEEGLRGVCVIGPAPGAIPPPFRSSMELPDAGVPERAFIARHADRLPHELSFLMEHRGTLMRRPICLDELSLHDDRIDALQDVVRSYGRGVWRCLCDAVAVGDADACFAETLMALESGRHDRIFEAVHHARGLKAERSLLRAFGWVSPRFLRGVVVALARSTDPSDRLLATSCLGLHRVSAGELMSSMLADSDLGVRARALRLTGEVGDRARLPDLSSALNDPVAEVRFWAAYS
ncbi:MAG: HEAT repeat domain-containing protein, partial [Nitrospira sp.]|nr:HEAT repeat domain-containing protein [Nitrospira sp.]